MPPLEDNTDTTDLDDAREAAELDAGFKGIEPPARPKEPAPAATPRAEATTEVPEYVQVTAKDWAEIKAAAAKTASYDQQLSKVFGTLGNVQKIINGLQSATPAGRKVEIPKDAFAGMEKDFPEIAQQIRGALEATLSGMHGTGANDAPAVDIEAKLAAYTAKRELEILEDAYPDWRQVVGAVDVRSEQPDPNNAFRRWLATKDAAYQNRVNTSESAAVIGRAIRLFQSETKATPKAATTPRDAARADRIRGAVQPRGDGAPVPAGRTDDDDFLAGFNSR
jgi:hypothetical protein